MSKSAVQFLGTRQEIFSFIEAIRSTVNVVVATENAFCGAQRQLVR